MIAIVDDPVMKISVNETCQIYFLQKVQFFADQNFSLKNERYILKNSISKIIDIKYTVTDILSSTNYIVWYYTKGK